MSILKLPIQFNGLKGVYLGNSIVSFEKLLRDAKIFQIFEGTNEIQRIVIANNVIGR